VTVADDSVADPLEQRTRGKVSGWFEAHGRLIGSVASQFTPSYRQARPDRGGHAVGKRVPLGMLKATPDPPRAGA
jgi:hypothetical protein